MSSPPSSSPRPPWPTTWPTRCRRAPRGRASSASSCPPWRRSRGWRPCGCRSRAAWAARRPCRPPRRGSRAPSGCRTWVTRWTTAQPPRSRAWACWASRCGCATPRRRQHPPPTGRTTAPPPTPPRCQPCSPCHARPCPTRAAARGGTRPAPPSRRPTAPGRRWPRATTRPQRPRWAWTWTSSWARTTRCSSPRMLSARLSWLGCRQRVQSRS
mmetsp:Transcript_27219/g.69309  ORF Transcript_27219/g.69309 Transcript_27219/m.69309 type:complete len:213 (-) Transcript_27219:114-752(-)